MRVWTTFNGEITLASQGAASLLHLSATSLRRRAVDRFFDGNRRQLFTSLDRAARGHADVFDAVLRPRERRPVPVSVRVEPDPLNGALAVWTFTVAPVAQAVIGGPVAAAPEPIRTRQLRTFRSSRSNWRGSKLAT